MKKKFTLLFFVFGCGLSAQYIITPSQKPDIGDTYSSIPLDTVNVINGSSGPNQIWNYTNLILPVTPTINVISYVDATTIPNYSWYPGAYMAIVGPGGGFTAFDNDPNNYSLNWLKSMVGGVTSTKYSDPLTIYHYPIFYGSTFSDSTKLGAYYENPPSPYFVGQYRDYGVSSYTCTGYGTLNLPNGTSFSNVLKLNLTYHKIWVDENTGDSTGYQYTDSEEYFDASSKFPILSYSRSDGYNSSPFSSSPSHYYTKYVGINMVAVTDLKEISNLSAQVSVFPNPSNSCFYIKTSLVEIPVFTVRNTLGSELMLQTIKINDGNYSIDLSPYASGIYFLTVKTQKGQVTKKLLVQ